MGSMGDWRVTVVGTPAGGSLADPVLGLLSPRRMVARHAPGRPWGRWERAEIELCVPPGSDLAALRSSLFDLARQRGLDLLFTPSGWRASSLRLAAFDADSTLVDGEGIDELARRAGVLEEVAELTRRAMEGELEYAVSLRARVRLLRQLGQRDLEAVASALRLTPGAAPALLALKQAGVDLVVLSGGFDFYLAELLRRLPLDAALGNRLEVVRGRLTGELVGRILDGAGKAAALRRLLGERGLQAFQALAVGDGANDIPVLEMAGMGIGFRPKPALRAVADGIIHGHDLRPLVALLGLDPPAPGEGEDSGAKSGT